MPEESANAVRPLDVNPRPESPAPPAPPIAARVVLLLTAGVLIGWLFGSVTRNDDGQIEAVSSTVTPVTATVDSATGTADIRWQAASVLPGAADGLAPLAAVGAVELDDILYVHVIYGEGPDFLVTRSVLWESSDGAVWKDITPDLGNDVNITDIDVYERTLLLSGTAAGRVQLWRSLTDRAIGADTWNTIDLGPAPDLPSFFSGFRSVTSAVDANNEIVTMAVLPLDLATLVIDPILPPGVSLSDTRYLLESLDWATVRDLETGEVVFDLDESPELMARGSEVWVRIVDPEGEERLTIVPLDPGARLAFGDTTDLFYVPSEKVWQSSDGVDFDLVPFDDRAESVLVLSPTAFRSGFVGATKNDNGQVELWTSASGGHWSPLRWAVPDNCSIDFGPASLAASGEHLLLPGRIAGEVCEVNNGTWTIHTVHEPTDDSYSSVVGGDAGFAMVTKSVFGSAPRIAVSRDGRHWQTIAAPTNDAFGNVFVAGDRLVLVTTSDSSGTAGLNVRVGSLDR